MCNFQTIRKKKKKKERVVGESWSTANNARKEKELGKSGTNRNAN